MVPTAPQRSSSLKQAFRNILTNQSNGRIGLLNRCFLSLCFFQAWVFLLFHSSFIISFGSNLYDLLYLHSVMFAIIMLIFSAVVKYRRFARRCLLGIGITCAFAGTVGFFSPFQEDIARITYAILLGIGVGVLIPFIGKISTELPIESAVLNTFLGYTFASILFFTILSLPPLAGKILTALLPLLILATILFTPRDHPHPSGEAEKDVVLSIIHSKPLIAFFCGVGLIGIAFGFSMAFCSLAGEAVFVTANHWGLLFLCALGIGYYLYFRVSNRGFIFEDCFSLVVPITMMGLLAFSINPEMPSALIIAGFQLADMIFWVVYVWIARHSGLPQRVFCIGKACLFAGMIAGRSAARLAFSLAPDGSPNSVTAVVASIKRTTSPNVKARSLLTW